MEEGGCHHPPPWGRVSPHSPDVATIMRGGLGLGGLPGGRKGVRAVGSVQAFLKITSHQRWYCSQNGSLLRDIFDIISVPYLEKFKYKIITFTTEVCGT